MNAAMQLGRKIMNMEKEILEILATAISDVGSWQWWDTVKDVFQLEFDDVLLYDETQPEKAPHTSTIALRFIGRSFAVFLDNLEEEQGKKWYDRFHDDEIQYLPLEAYEFRFDDVKYAGEVLSSYRNSVSMKDYGGVETLSTAKHILAAKCENVGFVVGGDLIQVVGRKGKYTEEEVELAVKRWWGYWRDYWRLRNTNDAYEKDWACEITIPIDTDNPKGKYYEEDDCATTENTSRVFHGG